MFLGRGGYAYVFQSALPRRERQIDQNTVVGFINISIRAPAKGATHIDHPIIFVG